MQPDLKLIPNNYSQSQNSFTVEKNKLNTLLKNFEVNDVFTFEEKLETVQEVHGAAIHGLIAGHGSTDGLQLGKNRQGDLSRIAVLLQTAKVLKKAFRPTAILTLFSCSNGGKRVDGTPVLAKMIYQETDLTTQAPSTPTNIKDLSPVISDGQVVAINVEYETDDTHRFRKSGETVIPKPRK